MRSLRLKKSVSEHPVYPVHPVKKSVLRDLRAFVNSVRVVSVSVVVRQPTDGERGRKSEVRHIFNALWNELDGS